MFDAGIRRALEPRLARIAAHLDRPAITPDRITMAGLGIGLGSAATAAAGWWWPALGLWLLSRICDGLDGPLARRRRAATDARDSGQAGGFLDISADFIVYGATVAGVGIGAVATYGVAWLPFLLVMLAYYINGAAFLAFSSIAERTGRRLDDGRSLSFLGGLAEGAETILVHSLWLILPAQAALIAAVWAGIVGISAVQRVVVGYRSLR